MIILTDVDECAANPCGANGVCSESRQGLAVSDFRLSSSEELGSVYTKRQHQRCDNSAMTLQNGFVTHFQAYSLISMRTESLASSQNGRSVDADAWCKRALR